MLKQDIQIIAGKEVEKRCTLFTKDEMIHINTFDEIDVLDPTGYGDFYAAAIVYGFLQGWAFKRIGLFANAVGSIMATQRGAMEDIKSL